MRLHRLVAPLVLSLAPITISHRCSSLRSRARIRTVYARTVSHSRVSRAQSRQTST
jgi:hypothetical protein